MVTEPRHEHDDQGEESRGRAAGTDITIAYGDHGGKCPIEARKISRT
jgi:hypothetical protein